MIRQPKQALSLELRCLLTAAAAALLSHALPGMVEVRTRAGLVLQGDLLRREEAHAVLSSASGEGRVERRLELRDLELVVFSGDPPASPVPGVNALLVQRLPWIAWLEPGDRTALMELAETACRTSTASEALSIIRILRDAWGERDATHLRLLELEGELSARLGWQDRVAALAGQWCDAVDIRRRPVSAWGWWRRAEAAWRAQRIEEVAWIAAHPVALGVLPDALGLPECMAHLSAAERRLGNRERAASYDEETNRLGISPVRPATLEEWLPARTQPARDHPTSAGRPATTTGAQGAPADTRAGARRLNKTDYKR
jgi:hypothetical protein